MNKERVELVPGFDVSRIIVGLWQVADQERSGAALNPAEMIPYLEHYTSKGLTTFDMADHYGSSEIIAGHFQKQSDEHEVRLLTKWVPKPGILSREQVRAAIKRALDRMQVDTLDLLQFHAWNYADASWLDALQFLQELQSEGFIRQLGVTNFDAAHLKMALDTGIELVSNQVCHSVLDNRAAGKLLDLHQETGIKLLAFGTLAGGFLSDRWLHQSEPKQSSLTTWSQMKYKRFIDVAGGWDSFQELLRTLREIADKHQVEIANVAGAYVLQNPAVAAIIIGARLSEREHSEANLKTLDVQLDHEDLEKISGAQAKMNSIPGDCGDEYRKAPFLTASGDLSHHLEQMPSPYPVVVDQAGRSQVFTGTSWESLASYCRAIREGDRILVSGTTATHRNLTIGGTDPTSQTHFIIDKIEGALQALGSKLADVVRTRVFIHRVDDWEDVAKVHGERFRGINPANTMVQAHLIGKDLLVEIEAEAICQH